MPARQRKPPPLPQRAYRVFVGVKAEIRSAQDHARTVGAGDAAGDAACYLGDLLNIVRTAERLTGEIKIGIVVHFRTRGVHSAPERTYFNPTRDR